VIQFRAYQLGEKALQSFGALSKFTDRFADKEVAKGNLGDACEAFYLLLGDSANKSML
jgi:hypothetical protein